MAKTKNYLEIAKRKISVPADQPANKKYRRLLIYGRNKKGKTKFCMSAGQGEVLIMDPEQGTDEYILENPHRWPVDSWTDIDEVYKYIKLGKHPYKWLAVDGLTKISNMSLRWVMHQEEERNLERRPGVVDRRDYGKSGEMLKGLMFNLMSLPINIIFTAQERMIEANNGDEDDDAVETAAQYVPDLPKGPRNTINSIASVIGRIYTVKTTVKYRVKGTGEIKEKDDVLQRRLWIEPHPSFDTGYRSDFELPAYLKNPTVPRLISLIETGKV